MRIPRCLIQRVCVWFSVKIGAGPKDTYGAIQGAFGAGAYGRSAVYKWHLAFRSGWTKLGDLMRPGAPQRARTRRRIRQCRTILDGDRRITIDKISNSLGISHGSTWRLLHKDLKVSKKCAKMVPHELTPRQCRQRRAFCQDFLRRCRRVPSFLSWIMSTDEAWIYLTQQRSRRENKQWLTATENRPQEPIRSRNCKKLMLIPFIDRKGLVHMEIIRNRTINHTLFLDILQRVLDVIAVRRRGVRLQFHRYLLHMDNAPAHNALPVRRWMEAVEWFQLAHPPYLPDLSPCDFFFYFLC